MGMAPYMSMEIVSSWFGVLAAHQLLKRQHEGWHALQMSYAFRAWVTRLKLREIEIGLSRARLDIPWSHVTNLAHALAIRDDALANILGPVFLGNLEGKNQWCHPWTDCLFQVFTVKLYAKLRGLSFNPIPENAFPLGVYDDILNAWDDIDRLESALIRACDYHWEETQDMDDLGHVGAFSWTPYNIFPVEIHAIRRVREDQGLPMPTIDHPLMQTMLAHPPARMPEVHDEVLDQIIRRAREEGIAGDPW